MSRKKFGIYRYSNAAIDTDRMSAKEMISNCPGAGRLALWLLNKELDHWGERKKNPRWFQFSVTRMHEELNQSPFTIRKTLRYMEENRWIRRRYLYTRGRRGCLMFIRLVLPGEKFKWEREGTEHKGSMPEPPRTFTQNARMRVVAGMLQRGMTPHPADLNEHVDRILARWEAAKRIIPIGKHKLIEFPEKEWRAKKLADWGLPPAPDK